MEKLSADALRLALVTASMEYLTNEINNAHYRLSITSRCITVNHGYGQLYPLVKRIDYERTIQEMARETSM